MGTTLFDRHGRSLSLNVRGKALRSRIRAAVTQLDLAESERDFFATGKANEIVPPGGQVDWAGNLSAMEGEGGRDTLAAARMPELLNQMIENQVVRAAIERGGDEVTETDRATATTSLEQGLGADAAEKLAGDYLDFIIESNALAAAYQRVVLAELQGLDTPTKREQFLRRVYDAMVGSQPPYCIQEVRAATEAEAADLRDQLDGGASFEDVVAAADPAVNAGTVDGFIGCGTADQVAAAYAVDVEGAAAGDVFGPLAVSSADGSPSFAVIELASVDGPSFEQVRSQLEQAIPTDTSTLTEQSIDTTPFIQLLLAEAEVTVDARFGAWDPASSSVIDPSTSASAS